MTGSTTIFLESLKRVPNFEKRGYLTAQSCSPILLHQESNIERFLCCERNQVEEATQKFIKYWNQRQHIYDEKAFSPLTLSDSLSDSARRILSTGWAASLPGDSSDGPVCFFNPTSQLNEAEMSEQDMAQCIFYLLHTFSEDSEAQSNGVSLIVNYTSTESVLPQKAMKTFDDIIQALPVRIKTVNVVYNRDSKATEANDVTFFEDFLPLAFKTLLGSVAIEDRNEVVKKHTELHINRPQAELMKHLKNLGILQENLPTEIGGTLEREYYQKWMDSRIQKEESQDIDTNSALPFSFPGALATTSTTREKTRDSVQSKLKRNRRLCRMKATELRITHLRNQRTGIFTETEKLEKALMDALRIVQAVEGSKRDTAALSPSASTSIFQQAQRKMAANLAVNQMPQVCRQIAPLAAPVPVMSPVQAAPSLTGFDALYETRQPAKQYFQEQRAGLPLEVLHEMKLQVEEEKLRVREARLRLREKQLLEATAMSTLNRGMSNAPNPYSQTSFGNFNEAALRSSSLLPQEQILREYAAMMARRSTLSSQLQGRALDMRSSAMQQYQATRFF